MSLFRIVLREIVHRKLGFLLGVFAVAVAVGCVLGQLVILDEDDRRTETILHDKLREYQKVMAELDRSVRTTTKNMGFNLVIFHKDVDFSDFLTKGYIDRYMPESHVERLTSSSLKSINHLLPVLQRRVRLPEYEVEITLSGTVGEVAMAAQDKKKPILDEVPRGKVTLGHSLRTILTKGRDPDPITGKPAPLIPGDEVDILGRTFTVHKVQPKKVSPEDLTAWIHLHDAQELLDRKGQINALYALNCYCEAGHMDYIRKDVQSVLPDTQVEFELKALGRAELLAQSARTSGSVLEKTRQQRAELREQKEFFLTLLVPLVLLAALGLLGFLAWSNVRERRGEVGLYRALGWRFNQVFVLLLTRSLLAGLIGTLFGLFAALAAGRMLSGDYGWLDAHAVPLLIILAGAPVATVLAAGLPTFLAIRQDPAVILQQELT